MVQDNLMHRENERIEQSLCFPRTAGAEAEEQGGTVVCCLILELLGSSGGGWRDEGYEREYGIPKEPK